MGAVCKMRALAKGKDIDPYVERFVKLHELAFYGHKVSSKPDTLASWLPSLKCTLEILAA